MPAIQLARLRIQAAKLAEKFYAPSVFVRGFHDLCDIYAERTRRPGQTGEPPPLLTAYKVPAPVLRQVLDELSPFIAQDGEAALQLADALWAEPYLEFRMLAAFVLGTVSLDPPERVLERFRNWVDPGTDDRLLSVLVEQGLVRLRREALDRYLKEIKSWLGIEEIFSQRLGLRALLYLVRSREFNDLPLSMRLLAPLVRSAPHRLRPDIMDVIQILAERSPRETAYFLRQNLSVKTDNPGTAQIVRNSLRYFPPEDRASLRQAVRSGT
jgi:hypothetical protein